MNTISGTISMNNNWYELKEYNEQGNYIGSTYSFELAFIYQYCELHNITIKTHHN